MVKRVPLLFAATSVAIAPIGLIDPPSTYPLLWLNLAAALLWGCLWMLARRGYLDLVRVIVLGIALFQLGGLGFLYGRPPLTHFFLVTGLPATFLVFPRQQRGRMLLSAAGVIVLFIAIELGPEPRIPLEAVTLRTIQTFIVLGVLALAAALAIYSYRAVTFAEEELAQAHLKSENLLLNILPGPIAARLKENPGTIADKFESATILFADIVSFTPLTQRMAAGDVVSMLDAIFRKFDALAEIHGLEKIKTIGDAYMAAAGIPQPCGDHAQRVAEMALAMQLCVADHFGGRFPELSLRIGIAAGPVVAGVIGDRKFSYDLWGDAVNTASRMESHGLPGRIQVSAEARELLGDAYRFEARGPIEIKGKGPMTVYLLVGPAS